MNWLRRKSRSGTEPDHDPCIDLAREVLGKSKPGISDTDRRRDRTEDMPRGVDADFCYGGESNPCA